MIVVFDLTVHKYCYMISHTKTKQTIYNIDCYQTHMTINTNYLYQLHTIPDYM